MTSIVGNRVEDPACFRMDFSQGSRGWQVKDNVGVDRTQPGVVRGCKCRNIGLCGLCVIIRAGKTSIDRIACAG